MKSHEFELLRSTDSVHGCASNSCAHHVQLGNKAKSASIQQPRGFADESKQRAKRISERYEMQGTARAIFSAEGKKGGLKYPLDFHRTAKCHYIAHGQVAVLMSNEHGTTHYGGLMTCGNVFACPVCAAKVGERRRGELAELIDAVYEGQLGLNKKAIMLTFTFPHSFDQELCILVKRFAKALRKLRSGRKAIDRRKLLGFEGLVRALEVTYGQNGWHPHTHELWIVDQSVDVNVLRDALSREWLKICEKHGLTRGSEAHHVEAFLKHSVDIIDNCRASDYLAKTDKSWGIDSELAKASTKKGRKSGRSPFELLKDASSDKRSAALYLEFVLAMKGRASLFWSRGLKARVGIDDKTDEQLADEQEETATILLLISTVDWSLIRRREARAKVLLLAQRSGPSEVLEFISQLRALDQAEASAA